MTDENRDILIEMRADMKHVREKVDHLMVSDGKQWEKLDSLSVKTEGHDKTLSFLAKGFWGAVTGVVGLAIAYLKGDR
jgi:hypothetical protein